jgi:hypothetical protein
VTLGQIIDRGMRYTERRWVNPSWWNLLVLLPWTLGAILLIHDWKVDREIASREQTTHGVVTSHEPSNHNRYGYVFSANGNTFNGWETPKKEELEIGKQVVVYYDPKNPSKNALTDFGELSMDGFVLLPFMLFVIGLFVWSIGNRRKQYRMKSNQPTFSRS